jgi:hypothetical protein
MNDKIQDDVEEALALATVESNPFSNLKTE